MLIRRAVVFGATGATGRLITTELIRRGVAVRVVARSAAHLERDFATLDVERVEADVADAEGAKRAADGQDVVFHCVGLALGEYRRHPELARATARAANSAGACVLYVSGYWSFWPIGPGPITESSPREPAGEKQRARRDAEDAVIDAGGAVAILPDFYGPGAEHSLLNDALRAVVRGGPATWPGSVDAQREFIYIPDAAAPLVDIAMCDGAYGKRWIVPGAGPTKVRELIAIGAAHAGRRARAASISRWMVSLAAAAKPDAREFAELYDLYAGGVQFDGSRLRALIGPVKATAYQEGVRRTVDWLGGKAGRGAPPGAGPGGAGGGGVDAGRPLS